MTESTLTVITPAARVRGGVIVLHEAFGVTPHIKEVGGRLASVGWMAALPHLYHRSGDPVFDYDGDLGEISEHAARLSADGLLEDVDEAQEALAKQSILPENIAILGFCMGGSVALYAASEREYSAAVTFYGGGISEGGFGVPPLLRCLSRLQSVWLGFYGERDEWIPASEIDRLEEAAAAAPRTAELIRYAEAGHGFNCDARDSYRPAAAGDAWKRTLDFLDLWSTVGNI